MIRPPATGPLGCSVSPQRFFPAGVFPVTVDCRAAVDVKSGKVRRAHGEAPSSTAGKFFNRAE